MKKILMLLISIMLLGACDGFEYAQIEDVQLKSKVDKLIYKLEITHSGWKEAQNNEICSSACSIYTSINDIPISIFDDGDLFIESKKIPITTEQRARLLIIYKIYFNQKYHRLIDAALK